MKRAFLFLLILCISFATMAQSEGEFTSRYHTASKALQQKKYLDAKNQFIALKVAHENNIWPAYAAYKSALCSFYLKDYKRAEAELHNHLKTFPNWEKKGEVLYLLANIAFEQNHDNIALSIIPKIKGSKLFNEANSMKGFYLSKRSIQDLTNLHQVYSDDKFIAQILVNKIATHSADLDQIDFAKSLVKKHHLKAPQYGVSEKDGIKNDTIYVAALLPFNIKKLTQHPSSALPKMAVDLYWGMRIAKAKLDTSRYYVKLKAYDIRNNPDTLQALYKRGEFDHVRLFVGPIFDKDFEAILKIAHKLNVPVINPALSKKQFINDPNAFFLNPTTETQAGRAADFAKERFKAKKALIFTSNIAKQKEFAQAHKTQAEQLGISTKMQEVSTVKINLIEQLLEQNKDVDYIFVASTSKIVANEIMDQMKAKGIDKPIITFYAWKNFKPFDKEKMEAHKVYFIAPDYIKGKRSSGRLRRVYNNRAHFLTSSKFFRRVPDYTFKGYDIMNSFAKNLFLHPQGFHKELEDNEDFYNTFKGYSFAPNKHDNQYVPILTYRDKKLVLVYPVAHKIKEQKIEKK